MGAGIGGGDGFCTKKWKSGEGEGGAGSDVARGEKRGRGIEGRGGILMLHPATLTYPHSSL